MAVKTRSQKKTSLSRRKLYRSRVKRSLCRKKRTANCRRMKGCKMTKKGKLYCRKSKNTRKSTR
jgi:hypothetical protein